MEKMFRLPKPSSVVIESDGFFTFEWIKKERRLLIFVDVDGTCTASMVGDCGILEGLSHNEAIEKYFRPDEKECLNCKE